MDLGAVEAFLMVALEQHVTRAAAQLHVTQPAVSARLSRLESDLGAQLFHRTPKGVVLTEAGKVFRPFAHEAVATLRAGREFVERLANLELGDLSIGGGATATTYLLPPILGAFHARFEDIRLHVREQGSQAVMDALLRGDLDLGVVTLPDGRLTDGYERLELEPWLEDELRLIVPPGHRLAKQTRFHWHDLDGEPLVLFEADTAVRRVIDTRLADEEVQVHIVMELRSIESIKQMVAQGIGAAFVSRYALPTPDAGLRGAHGPVTRRLAIATRADRAPTATTRAFRELMLEAKPE